MRKHMESKMTPGPWHNDSRNFGYDSRHVCGPRHADGGDYAPICIANTEANAKAIAALPELIEALTLMCAEFRAADLPYGSRAYTLAIDALHKSGQFKPY